MSAGRAGFVGTGVAVEIPARPCRAGAAAIGPGARHGIALVNAPGLIDSGYRGELKVLLLNTDREHAFEVAPGDRIAQLLLVPFAAAEPLQAAELSESARGADGFGSTGKMTARLAALRPARLRVADNARLAALRAARLRVAIPDQPWSAAQRAAAWAASSKRSSSGSSSGRVPSRCPIARAISSSASQAFLGSRESAAPPYFDCVLAHHGFEGSRARGFGLPEALALQRLNALDAGVKGAGAGTTGVRRLLLIARRAVCRRGLEGWCRDRGRIERPRGWGPGVV